MNLNSVPQMELRPAQVINFLAMPSQTMKDFAIVTDPEL